jgi:PTS system nitrogen regulatory IIA component
MLTEYLDKEKILLDLRTSDLRETLQEMLRVSSEKKHSQIIESIMKRESLMATALGKGVALPRMIIGDKAKTEIIVALSPHGISLKSLDRLPVKIIFLYLLSKNDEYPAILAQSLRLLSEESLRVALLNSKTAEDIIAIVKKWEQE